MKDPGKEQTRKQKLLQLLRELQYAWEGFSGQIVIHLHEGGISCVDRTEKMKD